MTKAHRLVPGTAIGEFVVGDLLGQGGFGTVYRAVGPDGDAVAIKVFKQEAAKPPTHLLATQQNEIEALFRLNHPSVVRVKRYGYLEEGGLWVAMELAEGEPLDRYLKRRGRLDTIEAIRIVRKVAEALAYCHDLNIVHLDLKPQNIILVDPHEPRVKVLDFGLAHIEGIWKPTDSRVRAGTIAYMAPEVLARGRAPSTSPRVDLHALGIIFYQLLGGRLPFEFANATELIERKQSGDTVPLRDVAPDVPEAVASVVRQLLATDPGERPSNAAWLVEHLQALYFITLGGDPTSVPAAPPSIVVTPEGVPLLGRHAELDRLRSAFESVGSGEGRAIMLVAEAGLGKSRLVSEFLNDETVSSRALIAYGRCRELHGLAAYSPLREALGQLARRAIDARGGLDDALWQVLVRSIEGDAALLCGLVPEFRQLAPALPESEEAAAKLMAAPHVSRAIRRLLADIGRARPVVLVLEDLDHADEGTLSVATQLTHPDTPPGVLLLWTRRTDEPMPFSGAVERLPLAPFDTVTNREHLGRLLPGATAEVVALLEHSIPMLSAGNPLFNTQVLRNLETEGYLARSSTGALVLAPRVVSDYTPPESVSTALRRTLARLDPDVLSVMSVAALFGNQFALSDMIALGLFPEDRVLLAVADATRHYLTRTTGDVCAFVHESIRKHLEVMLVPERLPELHGRIAQQLQQRGSSPATLAYHAERAGNLVEASRLHLEAGLEFDGLHDPVGSCRHLQQALELLATLPASRERDDLLVRAAHELSRVGCLVGNTTQTMGDLDRCAALLTTTDPQHRIALKAAYARVFYAQGDFQNAVAQSRECVALIQHHPEFSAYACVPTNILGRVLIASGKPKAAVLLLTKGCDLARTAGEYVELAHSEGVLSVALAHTGDYQRAEQYVASCEQLAARLGDPLRLAGAYFYYSVLAETRFDWSMGVKYTTLLLSYADRHGIGGLYLLMGTMFAGRHQFHMGRLHRAEVLLLNALNLSSLVGISMGVGWAHAFLGDVHYAAGRIGQAREWYLKGLEIGNAGGRDEYAAGLSLIGLAQCAAKARQVSDVRTLAETAIDRLRDAGLQSVLAHAFQRYADALQTIGDPDAAARAREHERAQFDTLGVPPCAWHPQVAEAPAYPGTAGGSADGTTRSPGTGLASAADADTGVEQITGFGSDQSLLDELSTIDGFVPQFLNSRRPA